MDKESIYELQKIDCNCNDCVFMVRDLEKLKEAKQNNRNFYAWSYRFRRQKMWNKAQKKLDQGDMKKYLGTLHDRARIGLDTSYKSGLSYGKCEKFSKDVSFIANTFQFETQQCFIHRKDV